MKSRTSFLVICVDQMQAACLGCAGHAEVRTPHLDRLAAEGVRFSRAYCENPLCTPSRISILTGLSSRQHGAYTLGCLVPETVPTVASVLRAEGYRTKACGKLHLQPWGLEQGRKAHGGRGYEGLFSHEDASLWKDKKIERIPEGFFGFESCDYVTGHVDYIGGDYLNWLDEEHPEWAKELRERWHKQAWSYREKAEDEETPGGIAETFRMRVPPEIHYNNWIADRSIAFLETLEDKEPFFLWCSFPDPHHPFAATKPYSEMYDPAKLALPDTWSRPPDSDTGMPGVPRSAHSVQLDRFNEAGLREMLAQTYGMITHVDDNVGRVLEALRASGRYDDTVIVFMSDHGDYLGAHHLVCKGTHPYEEVMQVPYIWSSPSSRAKAGDGQVDGGLVSLLDFAPTVMDYAGLPLEWLSPRANTFADPRLALPWFDGASLRRSVDGDEPVGERFLIGVKEENKVLPSARDYDKTIRVRCYWRGPWKLIIVSHPAGNHCLFNLEEDPRELRNRWDDPAYREIRDELMIEYAERAAQSEYAGVGRLSGP